MLGRILFLAFIKRLISSLSLLGAYLEWRGLEPHLIMGGCCCSVGSLPVGLAISGGLEE